MDQTLRLCSQIQRTISDVDLLSEATESDHDKTDLVIDGSLGESGRTHSGVGSPEESLIDDIDDRTFREQVDQLLREARDYINDDENNRTENDVDYAGRETIGTSSQPSVQESIDFSRQPSMSISLVHHENLEMKGTSSCADDGNTHSDSEDGFESPALIPNNEFRRQNNMCTYEELGLENIASPKQDREGKDHQPALTSERMEITLGAQNSTSMHNDWTEADHEDGWNRLMDENADLKKECEELTTRCVNIEKELAKAQNQVLIERAEVKRSLGEQNKDKAELTRMKTLLSQTKVEISQVRTEMVNTRTELAKAKTEIIQGRTELSETRSKLFKANEDSQLEKARLKELQQVVHELKLKETNAEKEFQEKLDSLEKKRQKRTKSLKQTLRTVQDRVDELESEKVGRDEKMEKLKLLNEKKEKKYEDLQLHCKSLMKERQELQSLCDQHEKMTNNVQQHCQTLMQERKELKKLCDEHQQENYTMKKTIKQLNLEKAGVEGQFWQSEKKLLEKKVEQLESENREVTSKMEEQTVELERIQLELSALESAGVARSTWYVEIRKEHKELTMENEALTDKMKKLKDANNEFARELGRYKAENTEMDSRMQNVNADMTKMKLGFIGDLQASKDEAHIMKNLLIKAQEEESFARKQLEELHASITALLNLSAVGLEDKDLLLPDVDCGSMWTKDNKRWLALKKHISGIANELIASREVSQRSQKQNDAMKEKHDVLQDKYDTLCVMHLNSLNDFFLPQRKTS